MRSATGELYPDTALQLDVVSRPNDWVDSARAIARGAIGPKGQLYLRFWEGFLATARERQPNWTHNRDTWSNNSLNVGYLDRSGHMSFAVVFGLRGLRYEVYIDTGDLDENISLFYALRSHLMNRPDGYGSRLVYDDVEGRRAKRIAEYLEGADVSEEERWGEYVEWAVAAGERMREALSDFVAP
jgi:hypothetical protein